MHAQTAMIENGFLHLPKEAAWLAEYLHELSVFPNGKHDDQVDSTAQMLDWLKQAGRGHLQRRDLAFIQTAVQRPTGFRFGKPAARAIIGDGEEVGSPPLVTNGAMQSVRRGISDVRSLVGIQKDNHRRLLVCRAITFHQARRDRLVHDHRRLTPPFGRCRASNFALLSRMRSANDALCSL
jgi:hypothetical protein